MNNRRQRICVASCYDLRIDDEHISAVLNSEETILPAEVKAEICAATKRHADIILNQLRELQVDLLPAHEEDGEMIIYGSARHRRRWGSTAQR